MILYPSIHLSKYWLSLVAFACKSALVQKLNVTILCLSSCRRQRSSCSHLLSSKHAVYTWYASRCNSIYNVCVDQPIRSKYQYPVYTLEKRRIGSNAQFCYSLGVFVFSALSSIHKLANRC